MGAEVCLANTDSRVNFGQYKGQGVGWTSIMVPKNVIREKRKSQPHVGTLFKNTTPQSEKVNRFTFRIAIIFGK
jgi:hypothetical protein